VSFISLIVLLGCVFPAADPRVNSTIPAPASAFLPPVGHTAHYRYLDTVTGPKQTKNQAAMVTIASVTEGQVRVTVAVDGQESSNLDLSVDANGALQRTSGPPEQTPATQEFLTRLSLAARIGANPRVATAFPVLLNIPWASGPVNPLIRVQPTEADGLVATASAATTVNSPSQKQHLHFLVAPGVGLAGALIGGTTGRVVALSGLVTSTIVARRSSPGPERTNVTLHVTGHLANGRLQSLSGDQENSVHARRHTDIFSDKWSFIAEDGLI
jgi:hypothetical protein